MGLNGIRCILVRKTHRREDKEEKATWPQAKECLEPPELKKAREVSPLEPLERLWPCLPFDFVAGLFFFPLVNRSSWSHRCFENEEVDRT